MTKAESIYGLELLEKWTDPNGGEFIRVPGGWVFTLMAWDREGNVGFNTVFIPYSDEFNPIGD